MHLHSTMIFILDVDFNENIPFQNPSVLMRNSKVGVLALNACKNFMYIGVYNWCEVWVY